MNDDIVAGDIVLVPARVLMVYQGGDAHLQIDSVSAFGKTKTTGLYRPVSKLVKKLVKTEDGKEEGCEH